MYWVLQENEETEWIISSVPEQPVTLMREPKFLRRLERAESLALEGPGHLEGLGKLAALYHANGYLEQASLAYEGLLGVMPDDPKIYHRLASIVAGYGYLEEAIPLWEEAVVLDPAYIPARLRMGDAWLKLNDVESAREVYKAALTVDAEAAHIYLGLGRVAIAQDELEEARKHLEQAAKFSDYRVGVDLLASVYDQLGHSELGWGLLNTSAWGMYSDIADPWMEEILKDCFDAYRLASAGGLAAFNGDPVSGIAYLERAIELDPEVALYHFQLGQMAFESRAYGKAEKHLKRSVELQPDLADGWVYLIALLDHLRRPDEAEAALLRGFRLCPNSPGMHMEMGKYLMAQNMAWKAEEVFLKAAELRPNEAGAFIELARLYFGQNEVEKGIDAMKDALTAEPGHPVALSSMAFYSIQTGDRAASETYLARVRAQPRMSISEIQKLEQLYNDQFGGG